VFCNEGALLKILHPLEEHHFRLGSGHQMPETKVQMNIRIFKLTTWYRGFLWLLGMIHQHFFFGNKVAGTYTLKMRVQIDNT
jgi:hypothetical protein